MERDCPNHDSLAIFHQMPDIDSATTHPNNANSVWITGASVVAGGSSEIGRVWEALSKDKVLALPPPTLPDLAVEAGLDSGDARIVSRTQLLALSVAERAWTAARLPAQRNKLRGEGKKIRHARIGVVAGSSLGGLCAMDLDLANGGEPSPYALSRWRGNSSAAAVALRFGCGGADFSTNAASATGAQTLYLAAMLVRLGVLDAVVAVAADEAPTESVLEAMHSNRSVSHSPEVRPLGMLRKGMKPCEGAACMILESEAHASTRGAEPLGAWLAGAAGNEARHFLAPDPEGEVMGEILAKILGRPEQGNLKNLWALLHATGTPRFDGIEIACLRRFFGGSLPWITAVKRTTGHALGASGMIEAVLAVEGFRRGEVPCWPSHTDPALALDGARPLNPPRPEFALLIGQGMGGTVVVNLLTQR
jgi:3-oxoacyl-(acyl-carrier-protein) synthase